MAEVLVGRSDELALIDAFASRARTDGEALLLFGEPGSGKTALLDAVGTMASRAGFLVLRGTGVEFEADLTFSGLHQVLLPLFENFARLSDAHQNALSAALGLGEGKPPDRLLVSTAVLTALRQAAATSPVLVIVDDLPWLDRASAGVLGFAARRLAGSRVGFLAASRPGQDCFFERAGLPQHELGPLAEEAANALVNSRFPELAPQVRQRVIAEAHGNPLALLELPAALSGAQRAAAEQLPAVLPLSRRLQELFACRVADLPASARRVLLLAALEATGDLRVLQTAARDEIEYLAAAEQAGLVHVDEGAGRLLFCHPLTRSAVVELSTSSERRLAHRALAVQLSGQPDRQAWHLAAAATGPDEEVAARLDQVAYRLTRRGDATGAVTALLRAADLSANGPSRSRRLAAAAHAGSTMTGGVDGVSEMLAAARSADPELAQSLPAAVTAAHLLLNADGDVDTAHRLMVSAIDATPEPDVASNNVITQALQTLMAVCYNGGRAELWRAFNSALGRLAAHVPADLLLLSQTIADPARTAAPVLDELDVAVGGLHDEVDNLRILTISAAAIFPDRLAGCREALLRVVREARVGGAVAQTCSALTSLSLDDLNVGRWDEAQQVADEGLDLARAGGGQWLLAWIFEHRLAALAAARGDMDTAQALADQITRWAAPRGIGLAEAHAHHVLVLAAMGRADFEGAYQHAAAISPPGVLAPYAPLALWVAMDLVEAAIRTGRHAEAAAHAAALRDSSIAALSPRLALLATASEAMAAPDDLASSLFEKALATPGADRFPFDLGRVRLYHGEQLRRTRAVIGSRAQLTSALEIFERLGAKPWATRAASELRAAGQTGPYAVRRDHPSLTSQELEIAQLAATGLTNKQIGQRLFLSHRTVGAHLYQIFPKLGITTRAALRDALASLPPAPPDDDHSQP
jgi:DNA-binding CsgD family transcriptional regulator